MSSLSNHSDGRRTIYTNLPGRPRIALGRIPKKQAESIARQVEVLEGAMIDGSAPPLATSQWLASLKPRLRNRLAALGLCEPIDEGRQMTLGQLIDHYAGIKFPNYKPGTVQVHRQAIASLEKHWGRGRVLRLITGGDAEDFRECLLQDGLAEATVRKRCAIASKLLRYAIKRRILDRNPFEDGEVPTGNTASPHSRYVAPDAAQRVLDQLADSQWRLLFVLSRWGGLRVGSEPRLMRWRHIDWAAGRILVQSPKTERYSGRSTRTIPIFPEVGAALMERLAVAQASGDADPDSLVLPMLAGRSDASLRQRVLTAVVRANESQWPRLWHNLRASRQTDLERRHPSHVVCAWLGNSRKVAEKHYLMVTDEDFETAQNTAQRVPAGGVNQLRAVTGGAKETPDFAGQSDHTLLGATSAKTTQRSGRDSNPRCLAARRFSRPVQSTTLPPDQLV